MIRYGPIATRPVNPLKTLKVKYCHGGQGGSERINVSSACQIFVLCITTEAVLGSNPPL